MCVMVLCKEQLRNIGNQCWDKNLEWGAGESEPLNLKTIIIYYLEPTSDGDVAFICFIQFSQKGYISGNRSHFWKYRCREEVLDTGRVILLIN